MESHRREMARRPVERLRVLPARRGGWRVEQTTLGALVGQGTDGAQVLVDGRRRETALLERDTVALHKWAR